MARTQYGPRAEYIGTGLLNTYSFDFKIKSLEHLIVGVVDTTEAKVFRVRGSDTTYLTSVTFTDAGGSVVLVTPLAANYKIYILLADDAPLQESQFKNKGDFTLQTVEAAFDVLSGQIQRLNYQVKRALKIGDQMVQAEADSFDTCIPFNTTNAGEQDNSDKVVCVGTDNKSFKMGPSVVTLAAQAAAAAASQAAAAASEANSAASAAAAAVSAATAALIAAKNTVYNGNGAPSALLGEDDSFYIDNVTKDMYGPKTAGAWPAPFNLVGPTGPTGNTGAAGAAGLFSSIAAVGALPNANGVSNVGGAFTLQPADATNPGLLTILAQSIAGVKSFVNYLVRGSTTGITAFAGGGQGSAVVLDKDINRVTTVATANDSVKLPAGVAGMEIVVINDGASTLAVFPATGEAIDALGANVAYSLPTSSKNVRFICAATGVWKTAAAGVAISFSAVGAVPNGNGASVAAGVITLQPADSTNPGYLSAGAQAIGGIKSFVDYIRRSSVSGLTAFATGGQASAVALTNDINRITTCATAGDSVKLPAAFAGAEIVVINDGAASANVFPATGESIDALGANAAYALSTTAKNVRFICPVNGVWKTAAGGGGSTNPSVFGSTGSPRSIVAGTGVTSGASHMSTTVLVQEVFVVGSVAATVCDISANPQIEAGTIVGQEINFYGTSDTAPVLFESGNGVISNGPRLLTNNTLWVVKWDGSNWREKSWTAA